MATVGRKLAVAEIGGFRFAGYLAWLIWLFVHLIALVGFRNRFVVLTQWTWNYVTNERNSRLIRG
jgi:NADH dehydrogenase